LNVVDDYADVLENSEKYGKIDILLLATPTQFLRNILKRLKNFLNYNIILVNVAKGLEIATKKRISEIIAEELENKPYNYVLLAGPTHAEEVAQKLPSAILSVSENEEAAKTVQTTFSNLYFRVYTGTDLMGAELAGALKNCLAIAAGIADGMGYGDNTKAALITRGINEMFEIAKYYNANPKTFMGLSGLGDIIVTCTSKHSRNRFVGEKLGQGEKIEDIVSHMNMVSEGAETIKALYKIIKENNLKAPIFTALYEVIYDGKPVSELESTFMSRDLKSEFSN
ncbi:NAD(P)H-dependent glycerol-3-phosphate dehydrogenase, partial [Leptotrichia hongkongensis]